jgi:hypothetical protein
LVEKVMIMVAIAVIRPTCQKAFAEIEGDGNYREPRATGTFGPAPDLRPAQLPAWRAWLR